MKVYVFGNIMLLVIVIYVFRKIVEVSDENVKNFVMRNFYVDDGLLLI